MYLVACSKVGTTVQVMRSISEINDYQEMTGDTPSSLAGEESDGEPRIQGPFPARVKGWRVSGERFVTETIVENLSAYHCYVRLNERVEPSDCLFVAARIYKAMVLLRGKVLQTLLRADGMWDVALHITRYRFIHRQKKSD